MPKSCDTLQWVVEWSLSKIIKKIFPHTKHPDWCAISGDTVDG